MASLGALWSFGIHPRHKICGGSNVLAEWLHAFDAQALDRSLGVHRTADEQSTALLGILKGARIVVANSRGAEITPEL